MVHVEHIGMIRNVYRILVRKPKVKRILEDLPTNGKIILEWNSNKQH
jgi:hypothetical protein